MILPHRFREHAFRRYEHYISQIVQEFPSTVSIDPSPLSPVTFSCRLRDAMVSLDKCGWETSIDLLKFKDIYKKTMVCETDGIIVVKPRKHTTSYTPKPKDIGMVLSNPTQEQLHEVAQQLTNRTLMGPVRVLGIPIAQLSKLSEKFDVHVAESNGEVVLL